MRLLPGLHMFDLDAPRVAIDDPAADQERIVSPHHPCPPRAEHYLRVIRCRGQTPQSLTLLPRRLWPCHSLPAQATFCTPRAGRAAASTQTTCRPSGSRGLLSVEHT